MANLVANDHPTTAGPVADVDLEISLMPPTEPPYWRSIVGDARMVNGFSIRRGRSRETDQFQTGDADYTLGNRDRDFDPNYTSSPLYGHVLPERRLRQLSRYNSVTYVTYDGFADGFEQKYDSYGKDATALVSAGDGFKVLAQADLPDSFYDFVVATDRPDHWWKLSEPANATVAVDSGYATDKWPGAYQGGVTLGATGIIPYGGSATCATFDGTNDVAGGLGVPVSSGTTATCECWFTIANETSGTYQLMYHLVSVAPLHFSALSVDSTGGNEGKLTLTVYKSGTSVGTAVSTARVDDGLPHHAAITSSSMTSVSLYLDGALVGTVSDATSVTNGGIVGVLLSQYWKGSIQSVPFWDGRVLTATEILAHYNAGASAITGEGTGTRVGRVLSYTNWPSSDRDVDTGSSTVGSFDLGGGAALDYIQTLADTEQAQVYCGLDSAMSSKDHFDFVWRARQALITATRSNTSNATFGENNLPYADVLFDYGEQRIYNEARVARSGGSEQVASDVASQRAYFKRSYTKTGLLYSNDNDAFDHATWAINRYADPEFRPIGLVIKPAADPSNLWPQVLGREIGDRITVKSPGDAVTVQCIIEGVEHMFASGDWTTTWRLSVADTTAYLILDDPVFGVLDSNALAF